MINSPDKSYTFLGRYNYKGRRCAFDLIATDFDDAQARLAAIALGGKIDGQLMAVIPASPPAGLFVRLVVFLRNRLFS